MPREMCTNRTPNECRIGVAVILHMRRPTHIPTYPEVYPLAGMEDIECPFDSCLRREGELLCHLTEMFF